MPLISNRPTRAAIAAVSLAAALILVGCGGSDSKSSSDSTTSDTATETTAGSSSGGSSASGSGTGSAAGANNGATGSTAASSVANGGTTANAGGGVATANFPEIAILECRISGTSGTLRVSASSAAGGDFKGVREVYVLTFNEYNASVKTSLQHIGYEDEWKATNVAFGNLFKNRMTIVAKSTDGATKSAEFSGASSPCP